MNGKEDGFVVALVSTKPWKEYLSNVTKAWRVDSKTAMFIAIPVKGIDCFNEEFGNE